MIRNSLNRKKSNNNYFLTTAFNKRAALGHPITIGPGGILGYTRLYRTSITVSFCVIGALNTALNSPCVPTGSLMLPLRPYFVCNSAGLNQRTSFGSKNMCLITAYRFRTRMGIPVSTIYIHAIRCEAKTWRGLSYFLENDAIRIDTHQSSHRYQLSTGIIAKHEDRTRQVCDRCIYACDSISTWLQKSLHLVLVAV